MIVPKTLCWVPNPFIPTHDKQCLYCGRLEQVTSCSKSSFIECKFQCGAKFCNEICRSNATSKQHHDKLCVGPLTSDDPLYRLKIMALEGGENIYAIVMLALAVVVLMSTANESDDDMVNDMYISSSSSTSIKSQTAIDEQYNIAQATHELIIEIIKQEDAPTLQQWTTLLQYINQNYTPVHIRSNYAIECDKIAKDNNDAAEEYDYLLTLAETLSFIELVDEADQHFPPIEMFCLLKKNQPCSIVQHSCIPSHSIECNSGLQDLKYIHITSNESGVGDDVKKSNSMLTCSRISNNDLFADYEERTFALQVKGIKCNCIRCKFEQQQQQQQSTELSNNDCTMDELNSLMALARSQSRYDDAYDIVNAMIQLTPGCGKALLLQSRIVGWQGDFSKREILLNEAISLATSDQESIHAALREANAYYRRGDDDDEEQSAPSPWITAEGDLEDYVFIGEHILDANECQQMVQLAETYHGNKYDGDHNNNWTTSRHYAVPTTDVPIYQIPELLAWFNEQLKCSIFPAMHTNFDIDNTFRLRIFDAFLVKYDASTGQKRLPLHNDQSEYSLTIAMNSLN